MPSAAGSKVPADSTSPLTSSSITVVGAIRPPWPITVAGGSALPLESTATVRPGAPTSVVVRLSNAEDVGRQDGEQPGRNSATVPPTSTESPTATAGAAAVKTKIPS